MKTIRGFQANNRHRNYESIVQDIINHSDDLHYIYDRLGELAESYPEKLSEKPFALFNHFFKENAKLACFALFAASSTRRYFYNAEDLKKSEIITSTEHIRAEHIDFNSPFNIPLGVPQWKLLEDNYNQHGENIRLTMLNALVSVAYFKGELSPILGDYLLEATIEKGVKEHLVADDSKKYMLLTVAYDNIIPNFIPNLNASDTNLGNNYSPSETYYGLPLLNGIRIFNKGNEFNNIVYYMEAR